jgi:RNA polymerase sigma-70 factor (ECF subfamily)
LIDEDMLQQSLLSLVGAGDENAFAELYDLLAARAYSLAAYVVKDAQSAEDVVQDAFVRIWLMAHSYDSGRGSVKAWVLTVVRNRGIDHLRRLNARPHATVDIGTIDMGGSPEAVWNEVVRSVDSGLVQDALRSLPAEQRQVIDIAYFQGLSQQEISAELGLPLGTVKGRMRLALSKLRVSLGDADRSEVR